MPQRVIETWRPAVVPRGYFTRDIFATNYEAGQHVLFAGPTQMAGKTTLAFQLLEYVATPEMPAYVAVSKPDDPVTYREMKRLGYRLVRTWPVPRKVQELWGGKPSGYVIWPEFGDIDEDAEKAAAVTGALLRDRYAQGVKKKKGILVCDDTVVKSKLLGLDRYMTTHIAMAGAMKLGGWYFVQKPTDSGKASLWAYGNSAHIFLSKDLNRKNRIHYDNFGGHNPHLVEDISGTLNPYEFLYLNNKGEMCIVGAS
jgi:hypothetical protein